MSPKSSSENMTIWQPAYGGFPPSRRLKLYRLRTPHAKTHLHRTCKVGVIGYNPPLLSSTLCAKVRVDREDWMISVRIGAQGQQAAAVKGGRIR